MTCKKQLRREGLRTSAMRNDPWSRIYPPLAESRAKMGGALPCARIGWEVSEDGMPPRRRRSCIEAGCPT